MSQVIIRVDSSRQIGSGHVIRCLNLAEELRHRDITVNFISRELDGDNTDLIEKKGFQVYRFHDSETEYDDAKKTIAILEKINSIDYLIVDHYELSKQWEQQIRPFVKKIMAIDDVANREHDCDILLDQNFYFDQDSRYNNLLPTFCRPLFGPQYALLKKDFRLYRETLKDQHSNGTSILISFGGCDITNQTAKALIACSQLKKTELTINVVVGAANPHQKNLIELCANISNSHYFCQIDNMAKIMAETDFAIGAGGITTWERCCFGIPSIVMSIATNQENSARDLASYGAINYLGKSEHIDVDQLTHHIADLLDAPEKLKSMREVGKQLVDGNGCIRVLEQLDF